MKSDTINGNQPKKRFDIASFTVAYLFSIAPLTKWAQNLFERQEGGIVPIHVGIVVVLIVINLLFNSKVREKSFNKKALLFIVFCLALFTINKLMYKESTIQWPNFIVYSILPMATGMLFTIDTEKLLRYILYLSLLLIPVADKYFSMQIARTGVQLETIGMTISYNVMLYVMAAIIHFVYYRDRSNKVIWIAYAANIYYLYQIITFGTRGMFVCYLVLIFMIYLNRYDKNGKLVRSGTKNTAIFIVIAVVAVIVVMNIEAIVTAVYDFLSSKNINIYALDKSVRLMKSKEITNGRSGLVDIAIKGIKEHIIVGNGIGMFLPNTGVVYPHNMILQLLYELGIILSIPFFCLIIKATFQLVNNTRFTRDYNAILMLFFCASVPRLMFSSQLWIQSALWLMFVCVLVPENFGGRRIASV